MKLSWGARAKVKLSEIHDYIAAHNIEAAAQVVMDIVKAARPLPQFPMLGMASDDPDIRLLQVPGRPYLLPYRVVSNEIEILTVFDQRQERPDQWQ
jgi:toxin ParE1/3/4